MMHWAVIELWFQITSGTLLFYWHRLAVLQSGVSCAYVTKPMVQGLKVTQPIKKVPTFMKSQKFISAIINARYWALL
jgi:hypothetical protein